MSKRQNNAFTSGQNGTFNWLIRAFHWLMRTRLIWHLVEMNMAYMV
jgi:hypothetical protein